METVDLKIVTDPKRIRGREKLGKRGAFQTVGRARKC